jgi:FAD binding domain
VSGLSPEALERSPDTPVYRFICNVPTKDGIPPSPHSPPTPYVQSALNKYGPSHLSSDPSVNPNPIQVSQTTRYKSHAAIAERFFVRFRGDTGSVADDQSAAHIHSPAGGQGMNLGDAIGLAAVLAQHLKLAESHDDDDDDKVLRYYAAARHERAMSVIRLTKRFQMVPARFQSCILRKIMILALWCLGRIAAFRRAMAWRLSGLGAR